MRRARTREGTGDSRTDSALVRESVAGDREAFAELYRRYVRRIYNLVLRMLPAPGDAEDLTQEIFLQVYRNLASFEGRSGFYTWIYRVACNTCLQYRKKARHRSQETDLAAAPRALLEDPSPRRSPEQEVERRGLMTRVAEAIEQLPEQQRLVIVLGPIQGHGYHEIARILGEPQEVVKGRMHRARATLRRVLERGAQSPGEIPPPAARVPPVRAAASA